MSFLLGYFSRSASGVRLPGMIIGVHALSRLLHHGLAVMHLQALVRQFDFYRYLCSTWHTVHALRRVGLRAWFSPVIAFVAFENNS